MNIFPGNFLR